MDELFNKALQLKQLHEFVIKALNEHNIENFAKYLKEFRDVKMDIKTIWMKNPIIIPPDITDRDKSANDTLQKLSLGEIFPVEKEFQGSRLEDYLSELEQKEIDDLAWDLFFPWFSHYEYIRGLYNIGSLILNIDKVPENLFHFVDEARNCFAFQQYNAVYSLCRTILEMTIKDICSRGRLIKKNKNGEINFDSYTTRQLRDKVSNGNLNDRIQKLYKNTSSLIHGNITITEVVAKETFKETLKIVQELYSNHKKILSVNRK